MQAQRVDLFYEVTYGEPVPASPLLLRKISALCVMYPWPGVTQRHIILVPCRKQASSHFVSRLNCQSILEAGIPSRRHLSELLINTAVQVFLIVGWYSPMSPRVQNEILNSVIRLYKYTKMGRLSVPANPTSPAKMLRHPPCMQKCAG